MKKNMKKLTTELSHNEPKMKDGKAAEQLTEEDVYLFIVSSHQDLIYNHILLYRYS
jgi:hypothetical protein